MDRALTEFSKEIHLAVSFQPKEVTKFKSNAVKGRKVPFDAIVQLVRGASGLELHAGKAGLPLIEKICRILDYKLRNYRQN